MVKGSKRYSSITNCISSNEDGSIYSNPNKIEIQSRKTIVFFVTHLSDSFCFICATINKT